MQLKHKALCSTVGMLVVFFALAIIASAQEGAGQGQKTVSIKNFGQLDERFYRGAQPREDEFKELAALGIRTVIDLRDDPRDYEKGIVESLGMKYINIPMVGKKYPTEEAVQLFLKVVNDPGTGSFFVHCAGGRHRTGAMGAVYRYTKYGWDYEQVYAEMKKFDFYTSWGHGAFKDFVRDYYDRVQANRTPVNTAPTNPTTAGTAQAKTATTSVTVDGIMTTDSIASRK
jgi:protein tyrosine phosphatase (PTP) superfamily phosphohydrolase (DUF442 family)